MNLLNREGKVWVLMSAVLLSLLAVAIFPPTPAAQGVPGGPAAGTAASDHSPVTLTAEERAWLRDHPVITTANDPGWPPIEFTDARGEHAGMSADYLHLIEQRLGLKFKRVRDLSWMELYARAQRREIDMTTSVAATPPRLEVWAFTKPYLTVPIVIATRTDEPYIADMKELVGKKVALPEGSAVDHWITADWPGIHLVRVSNAQVGLTLLQQGEVFAFIDGLLIIGDYQAKLKVANIKIAGQTPYAYPLCMAVRKDWAPLVGILNKAMDSISESERAAIYRKWLPGRYEHGFDYTLFWRVLAGFAVILLGLALWIRKLAKEIKQRKRAEEALRESEERLRLAITAANQGLYDLNVQTGAATVSPEYATMLGYDPATFHETNAAWLERLHPEDQEPVAAIYRDYVSGRIVEYRVEFRQRAKSGDWKWILSLGKIVEWDAAGQPLRMLGTHTDITDRKQAEAALRQANLVVENSPVVLFRWQASKGWPVEMVSRNVSQFGYAPEELLSGAVPFAALVHPDDLERVAREVQEYSAAGADSFQQQYRIVAKDGGVRWVDDRTVVERNVSGQIKAYQGIVIDITERKRAEEALRESEKKYQSLFENAQVALFRTGISDGKLLEINERYAQIAGYSNVDACLAEFNAADAWTDPNARIDLRRILTEKGFVTDYETEIIRRDGNHSWILFSATIFPEQGFIEGSLVDITERKRSEERLRQANIVVENSPVVLFRWEAAEGWPVVMVSQNVIQFGYSPEELVSGTVPFTSMVHPGDLDRVGREVQEYAASGADQFRQEHRILTKDGGVRWVDNRIVVERNTEGQIIFYQGIVIDITDLKRTEEAVKTSEANLNSLINNRNESIWSLDRDYSFIIFNDFFQEAYWSAFQIKLEKGLNALDILTPEQRAFWKPKYDTALAGRNEVFEFSAPVGNEPNYFEVSLIPIWTEGRVAGVSALSINITERKRAEEKRLELSRLLEESLNEIYVFDADTLHFVQVNRGARSNLGYTMTELRSMTPLDLKPDFNKNTFLKLIDPLRTGAKPNTIFETKHRRKNNSYYEVEVHLQKGTFEGRPVFVAIIIDITERKRTEEALRESEERFAVFMENLPAGAFMKDVPGAVVYANRYLRELFGWGDIIGRSTRDLLSPEVAEKMEADDRAALAQGLTTVTEKVRDEAHRERVFQTSKFPIARAGRSPLLGGIAVDVTERIQAEEALRSSLEEKESLLKEVHHRVKNNLQVISSLLSLQFRQVKNAEVRSFLRDTQNRIRSMAMLHEILYHSENKARINFPQYVKDLCAQVARSLGSEARKIRLRQEIAPVALNLDQAVTAGLIINELVTNAFKHAFPSRSEGEILVALQAPDEHHLLLRVSDDGVGFPLERPPQRSESLGLLLVKNLSRQLEGRLSVTGRAGTVFEIIFPLNPLER